MKGAFSSPNRELSYQANKNNRFELFALGAPQRHGQMRFAQNIAAYDHEYAEGVFSDVVDTVPYPRKTFMIP